MTTLSNRIKTPTTKLYDKALMELSDKGPMDSSEYQEHQSYIESLLAQIEREAKRVNEIQEEIEFLEENWDRFEEWEAEVRHKELGALEADETPCSSYFPGLHRA